MKNKNIYIALTAFLVSGYGFAQDKKPTPDLGTEEVTVVRGYEAVINDAFKVKETPSMDSQEQLVKKEIEYTITSFPVASTFVPEKGEVAQVEDAPRLKPFSNYALASFGNYSNINAEVFLSEKLDKFSSIALFAKHKSGKGLKKELLDNNFAKTEFAAFYLGDKKNLGWRAELGGSMQTANWYGLATDRVDFSDAMLNNIDPKQKYKDIYVRANFDFRNLPFTSLEVGYDRFWDDYKTTENRFTIRPNIKTRIGYVSDLKVGLVVDYVSTQYKDLFVSPGIGQDIEYKNLNLGLQPSISFSDETYSVDLGLGIFYNDGKINSGSDNKFFVYPQIRATYNLVNDILVAYAGIEGGLKQNSFKDFVTLNPFVSPNLQIAPTSEKYDLYLGLRGKLDNNISFNVKGSYKNQSDFATFVSGVFPMSSSDQTPSYSYGNSFEVEYQNLKTLNLFGELRYEFESQVSIGVNAQYNHYKTDQLKPWNLPRFKAGADVNLEFDQGWFATMELFYAGERFDRFAFFNSITQEQSNFVSKLDGYVDLNIKVGYRPTMNWTIFVTGNNLLNNKYERFVNYKVQGLQGSLGAIYKFDFR
ncbi:TonB-dependent receptor domain-containing protein [Myroides sp. LJL115]